jgi:hypothetical protein
MPVQGYFFSGPAGVCGLGRLAVAASASSSLSSFWKSSRLRSGVEVGLLQLIALRQAG